MAGAARIGTEFGGYRVEALLGRGGTSTVYRAEHPKLGIKVALKVLNDDLAEDEAFRERFVRESRLAAAIGHPNIVPIYDAGVWHDSLYIAMRYVAGGDLRERLRGGPLPPRRALAVLAQAADGLDAAHANGLVHRDVKAANILVEAGPTPDAREVAYVTDFGLTRQAHSGGQATPTGVLVGTISYVAPEQIEGRPVDPRADEYSLACVAFEALTGRAPFVRETDAAVLWAHMRDDPPVPTAVRDDLPAKVDEVIARGMAKDPSARFSTCAELVGALRDAFDPATTTVRQSTPRERRPRAERPERARRKRRSLAAPAAGLALALAGLAAGLLLAGRYGDGGQTVTHVTTDMRTVPARSLLASVPEWIRRRCTPTQPPTAFFDESVTCRPARHAPPVQYSHAVSGPRLNGHFANRAAAVAGVPRPDPGEQLTTVGSCNLQQLPAVEEWTAVRRAGHDTVSSTGSDERGGWVLCYRAGGNVHIEWTTSRGGIYAHAYGSEFRPTYRWWQNEGGPLH
jgi:tRNA A-37 threonylcarbamoyl transferase component Bud32